MSSPADKHHPLMGQIIPISTLLTLIVSAIGAAAFVTDLDTTLDAAIEDLGDIKLEVKQMNMQLGSQANGITSLQERAESRNRRIDRVESELGEIRERVRALELKAKD